MDNLLEFEVSNVKIKPQQKAKSQVVRVPKKRMYSILIIISSLFLIMTISLFYLFKQNSSLSKEISNLTYKYNIINEELFNSNKKHQDYEDEKNQLRLENEGLRKTISKLNDKNKELEEKLVLSLNDDFDLLFK